MLINLVLLKLVRRRPAKAEEPFAFMTITQPHSEDNLKSEKATFDI